MTLQIKPLQIKMFPCLSDNYGFLVHDSASGQTACIDTPDGTEIMRQADIEGWTLTHILNTHHHFDHTGGNQMMKDALGLTVIGPRAEAAKIPAIDIAVGEGDVVTIGAFSAAVLDTPAHTLGHIAYHFASEGAIFVGDTLFALGCGRLFEGTPEQMFDAMEKFGTLLDETRVYCAHEYTLSNAAFALTVEPDNVDLQAYVKTAKALRAKGLPTVPTTIGAERAANPFMRAKTAARLGEIRAAKDNF